jgi:hypothetical protein
MEALRKTKPVLQQDASGKKQGVLGSADRSIFAG